MITIEEGGQVALDPAGRRTARLRYGLNGTVDLGSRLVTAPQRDCVCRRVRELGTQVVRMPVMGGGSLDPLEAWTPFASCVQAVLEAGAVPMITFSKFGPPYDDAGAVSAFAGRCAAIVAACLGEWGGEAVREWYWCVWHHPNSEWISAGLTFDHYRRIYEETAAAILGVLHPLLGEGRPRIGGPAADGFQPFWMDWVWRFVNEIDNDLIAFASWHYFGDWRELGAWGAPADQSTFAALLMARASEYETRARAVARVLKGRGILNVCGELNAHSHHEPRVTDEYNRTAFGAAYYASALLHLMRGGADLELLNGGADTAGLLGAIDGVYDPHPVFEAKRLCARCVRFGDVLRFPEAQADQGFDVVVADGGGSRRSVLIVHRNDESADCAVEEFTDGPWRDQTLLKIDRGTGGRAAEGRFDGLVRFEGYGVAAVTTSPVEARGER
jgi:hypothetical protein